MLVSAFQQGLDEPLWFLLRLEESFNNNHQETEKKVCDLHDLEITHHTWGHTVRSPRRKEEGGLEGGRRREREGGVKGRVSSHAIGLRFCLGWGPTFSRAHSLLVNLKHRGGI